MTSWSIRLCFVGIVSFLASGFVGCSSLGDCLSDQDCGQGNVCRNGVCAVSQEALLAKARKTESSQQDADNLCNDICSSFKRCKVPQTDICLDNCRKTLVPSAGRYRKDMFKEMSTCFQTASCSTLGEDSESRLWCIRASAQKVDPKYNHWDVTQMCADKIKACGSNEEPTGTCNILMLLKESELLKAKSCFKNFACDNTLSCLKNAIVGFAPASAPGGTSVPGGNGPDPKTKP